MAAAGSQTSSGTRCGGGQKNNSVEVMLPLACTNAPRPCTHPTVHAYLGNLQDWAKQLDYEESLRRQQQEGQQQQQQQQQQQAGGAQQAGKPDGGGNKGFLSLTSRVDLNSMDVDLSEQLRVRKRSAEEASSSSTQPRPAARRPPVKYGSVPPTRVEQRSWERSGKYSRKVVAVAPVNEAEQVGGHFCAGVQACSQPSPELRGGFASRMRSCSHAVVLWRCCNAPCITLCAADDPVLAGCTGCQGGCRAAAVRGAEGGAAGLGRRPHRGLPGCHLCILWQVRQGPRVPCVGMVAKLCLSV